MNIEHLATPIYQRAMGYLTVLHVVIITGAFLSGGEAAIGLFALAIFPYIAALPGSFISLAVFKVLMAKVNTVPPSSEVYNDVHIKALASCAAGAAATIIGLGAIMGSFSFLACWPYLIVPVFCTWLAVFQKRKLIYAAIQEAQQTRGNTLQQL